MTDGIPAFAFAAVLAIVAAAGILLIEDDAIRLAFLVAICAVALGSSRFISRSDSRGAEGIDFVVPLVAAILISTIAFEDDRQKLASAIVLTLIFSLGWRALRRRRGRLA